MDKKSRLELIREERTKETVTVNRNDLKAFIMVCEDMCSILQSIRNNEHSKEDDGYFIDEIVKKYKDIYPKTYRW